MGAVNLTGYKDVSSHTFWDKDEQWFKATYDFDTHGGTSAATTYTIVELPVGYVITNAFLVVNTAVEGTSSTMEAGFAGSTAALLAQTAEASLAAGDIVNLVGQQVVGANNSFYMTIGTADLTAGNVDFWVKAKRA